jgi:hypothetical protein
MELTRYVVLGLTMPSRQRRVHRPVHRAAIVVDNNEERLLNTLSTIDLPDVPKWIRRDET